VKIELSSFKKKLQIVGLKGRVKFPVVDNANAGAAGVHVAHEHLGLGDVDRLGNVGALFVDDGHVAAGGDVGEGRVFAGH